MLPLPLLLLVGLEKGLVVMVLMEEAEVLMEEAEVLLLVLVKVVVLESLMEEEGVH